MKQRLRLGWDVGGWHCYNGASRDALVLLTYNDVSLARVGKSWRGNIAPLLLKHRELQLVVELLRLCSFQPDNDFDLIIAIDTPLGWPDHFLSLLQGDDFISSATMDDTENLYTRRQTEIDIIKSRFYRVNRAGETHPTLAIKPLSPVRDMIGSQSTKGIHFLRASGQQPSTSGIFQMERDGCSITMIEAYPSLARSVRNKKYDGIFKDLSVVSDDEDVSDALQCAIVAHLYGDSPSEIASPLSDYSLNEGRIFYPRPGSSFIGNT